MSSNGGARSGAQAWSTQRGKYSISSVVTDSSTASALPSLSALTANSYLSSSLGSLGTSFTPSGLPAAAAGTKSVAQRRAVAPPLVVGEVRRVDDKEFETYLHAVTGEYQRWQWENELGRQGTADLSLDGDGMVGLGVMVGTGGRRANKEEPLPALSAVPQIFFDPNFNLGNPRTFDLVTERIQLSQSAQSGSKLAPSATNATASSPALSSSMSPTLDSVTTKMNKASSGTDSDPLPGLGPLTLADLATDQILQEKLSHYTALIESHLVREIGLRSSSFFAALSNLQSLHAQGEDCLHKIAELQAALDSDGRGVGGAATRGLKVLRAQARRRALERVGEGVRVVQEVQEGVEGVKELVEAGEWVGALEVSDQIEQLYYRSSTGAGSDQTQPSTSTSALAKPKAPSLAINLTKVNALNHVPDKLAVLRAQVATALEAELIGVLGRELDEGVGEYVRLEGKWKGKGKQVQVDEESSYSHARERAKERIRPGVRGLVRADGMDKAVAAWRESVLKEIRNRVRQHLPTSEPATNEEDDVFSRVADRKASLELASVSDKSLTLARNLRALSPKDFLHLARATYLDLLGCIELTQLHAEVLSELAIELREEERLRKARRRGPTPEDENEPIERPPRSSSLNVPGAVDGQPNDSHDSPSSAVSSTGSEDGSGLLTEIADVAHAAAELANLRFSKVIGVRGEIHARLSLADFVDIFEATWSFVVGCEVVCKRMIVGLRGVMVGQAKAFLQGFHQDKVTTSAKVVEEEQWSPADVPRSAQEVVGLIAAAAVQDPPALILGERQVPGSDQEAADVTGASSKQLSIDGGDFFAVPAVLVTLDVLVEYLKVVVNLPLLTTDLMAKVIEFLKAFNSRTCQVVLGAGAMRSAGLKNITAKHLALASQALSIMIALIPNLRETLRRHLNPKQAVMLVEFDKLQRDFHEHQNEIHAKLVAIMADRLDVHCKSLQAVDWEKDTKDGGPNAYVGALTKEHATLNKVISRYLQQATIEAIMGQVCANLDARLKVEFGRIEIKSDGAKDRLKVDATSLRTRLIELNGVDDPLADLEAIVEAKVVPEPAPPPISRNPSLTALRSPSVTSLASPQLDASATLGPSPRASVELSRTSSDAPAPTPPLVEPAAAPPAPALAPTPVSAPLARKKTMSERLAEIARRNRGPPKPVPAPVQEEVPEPKPEGARVTEVEGVQLPPPPSATPDEWQPRLAPKPTSTPAVVTADKSEAELPALPAEPVEASAEAVEGAVQDVWGSEAASGADGGEAVETVGPEEGQVEQAAALTEVDPAEPAEEAAAETPVGAPDGAPVKAVVAHDVADAKAEEMLAPADEPAAADDAAEEEPEATGEAVEPPTEEAGDTAAGEAESELALVADHPANEQQAPSPEATASIAEPFDEDAAAPVPEADAATVLPVVETTTADAAALLKEAEAEAEAEVVREDMNGPHADAEGDAGTEGGDEEAAELAEAEALIAEGEEGGLLAEMEAEEEEEEGSFL